MSASKHSPAMPSIVKPSLPDMALPCHVALKEERHLDPGVPGLVAEAAEGKEALGALRAVLGVLQAGAGAARAVHAVRHLLQRQRQLQVLPALQLLLLQQAPQALRPCQCQRSSHQPHHNVPLKANGPPCAECDDHHSSFHAVHFYTVHPGKALLRIALQLPLALSTQSVPEMRTDMI